MSSTKLAPTTEGLQRQEWYHGLRSRGETLPLFHNRGDFLVRTIIDSDKNLEFVLSICVTSEASPPTVQHLSLYFDEKDKSWELSLLKKDKQPSRERRAKFTSVLDLVKYYTNYPIISGLKLQKAIPRPKYLIPSSFILPEVRGESSFGKVIKAKLQVPSQNVVVAVKGLTSTEDMSKMEVVRESIMREVKEMRKYSHPNVVKIYGVINDKLPLSLVMEFCSGGNLEQHLRSQGAKISTDERISYMLESARGLRYLHHHGCLHRNLASRNCLISSDGRIKITDFGLSKIVENNDIDDGIGINENAPIRWMAPEIISLKPRYSTKSDVWAYGVMIYEIFNYGIQPWSEIFNVKVIAHYIRCGNMPTPPPKTPETIATFMNCCWDFEQGHRPEFSEIVKLIIKLQEVDPQLRPSKPDALTLNELSGIQRYENLELPEELLALKSLDGSTRDTLQSSDELQEYMGYKNRHQEFEAEQTKIL